MHSISHTEGRPLLPQEAVAVQCTLFDKSTDKNWLVALHQDLSIPVRERILNPECAGWSVKEGVVYVQPPVAVLESLLAVRVHLDDCGPESGPLRGRIGMVGCLQMQRTLCATNMGRSSASPAAVES